LSVFHFVRNQLVFCEKQSHYRNSIVLEEHNPSIKLHMGLAVGCSQYRGLNNKYTNIN
jgi:hypothetical protein